MNIVLTVAPIVHDGIELRFEHIFAGLFLVVIVGGLYGLLWFRKHPDVD